MKLKPKREGGEGGAADEKKVEGGWTYTYTYTGQRMRLLAGGCSGQRAHWAESGPLMGVLYCGPAVWGSDLMCVKWSSMPVIQSPA